MQRRGLGANDHKTKIYSGGGKSLPLWIDDT